MNQVQLLCLINNLDLKRSFYLPLLELAGVIFVFFDGEAITFKLYKSTSLYNIKFIWTKYI